MVNRELQEVKRKYYQQRRREQLMSELEGSVTQQGKRERVDEWRRECMHEWRREG